MGSSCPASLDDLTRPEYKGLLVVENPATSSPGLAFLLASVGAFGDPGYLDFWKGLAANDVLVVNGWEIGLLHRVQRFGRQRPAPDRRLVRFQPGVRGRLRCHRRQRAAHRCHRRRRHLLPPDRVRRHPARHSQPRPGRSLDRLHALAALPGGHAAANVRLPGQPGGQAGGSLREVPGRTRPGRWWWRRTRSRPSARSGSRPGARSCCAEAALARAWQPRFAPRGCGRRRRFSWRCSTSTRWSRFLRLSLARGASLAAPFAEVLSSAVQRQILGFTFLPGGALDAADAGGRPAGGVPAGSLRFPRALPAAGADRHPLRHADAGGGAAFNALLGPRGWVNLALMGLFQLRRPASVPPHAGRHPAGACLLQHHHRAAHGGRLLVAPRPAPGRGRAAPWVRPVGRSCGASRCRCCCRPSPPRRCSSSCSTSPPSA